MNGIASAPEVGMTDWPTLALALNCIALLCGVFSVLTAAALQPDGISRRAKSALWLFLLGATLWALAFGLEWANMLTREVGPNFASAGSQIFGVAIAGAFFVAATLLRREIDRPPRFTIWTFNVTLVGAVTIGCWYYGRWQSDPTAETWLQAASCLNNAAAMWALGRALIFIAPRSKQATDEPRLPVWLRRLTRFTGQCVLIYATLQLLPVLAPLLPGSREIMTGTKLFALLLKLPLFAGFAAWAMVSSRQLYADMQQRQALEDHRKVVAGLRDRTRDAVLELVRAEDWPALRARIVQAVSDIVQATEVTLWIRCEREHGPAYVAGTRQVAGCPVEIPLSEEVRGGKIPLSDAGNTHRRRTIVTIESGELGYLEIDHGPITPEVAARLQTVEVVAAAISSAYTSLSRELLSREIDAMRNIVLAQGDDLGQVARHLVSALSAQAIGIWRRDGSILRPAASAGLSRSVFKSVEYDLEADNGWTVSAFNAGEARWSTDIGQVTGTNEGTIAKLQEALRDAHGDESLIRGWMGAPVRIGDRIEMFVKVLNRDIDAGFAPVRWHCPERLTNLQTLSSVLGGVLSQATDRAHLVVALDESRQARTLAEASRQAAEAARTTAERESVRAARAQAEAEKAAEQARRKEEDRKVAFALLSHELRSPVSGVMMIARSIRYRRRVSTVSSSDLDEAFSDILSECERYLDMFGNWSAVIDAVLGRRDLARQSVDLVQALEYAIERCLDHTEARSRNARIEWDVSGSVAVVGDRTLIRQALWNIIMNAVKYGVKTSDDVIRIDVGSIIRRDRSNIIRVAVRDSGDGVDHAERKAVYRLFYRGRATRDSQQGAGLGLFFARRIVEQCGGSLYHRNNLQLKTKPNGGRGTTFFIDFEAA